MLSPEVEKKIKEIQIHTRRALRGTQVGGHVTSQKGSGYEFDQLKTYEFGDDIRFVDWKSSARTGQLLVKQYFEERNRTIWICLDVSSSTYFSSSEMFKSDAMQQTAAIFTLLSQYEKDSVGLLLFSDKIEKVIPPSSGRPHSIRLMEAIFSHQPESQKTDLNILFEHIAEKIKKSAMVIVISDFIDENYEKKLQRATCRRELIAVRCLDRHEKKMPDAGYVLSQDPETKEEMLINFSGSAKMQIQKKIEHRIDQQNLLLKKHHVDILDIVPGREVVNDIILFFRKRMMYR